MADDDFEFQLGQDLPRGQKGPLEGDRGMSAWWQTADELASAKWDHQGGLLLGRRDERLIGWKDDRHVMTIAGSRAGKGVSLIVPNLLLYEGSALVFDPKGENAKITAGRRGKAPP
jgi:type IV secretion system protein VirD4